MRAPTIIDDLHGLACSFRSLVEHVGGDAGSDVDESDRVRDGVADLARDPEPFLVAPGAGRQAERLGAVLHVANTGVPAEKRLPTARPPTSRGVVPRELCTSNCASAAAC